MDLIDSITVELISSRSMEDDSEEYFNDDIDFLFLNY